MTIQISTPRMSIMSAEEYNRRTMEEHNKREEQERNGGFGTKKEVAGQPLGSSLGHTRFVVDEASFKSLTAFEEAKKICALLNAKANSN